jgi:hypothetical protein
MTCHPEAIRSIGEGPRLDLIKFSPLPNSAATKNQTTTPPDSSPYLNFPYILLNMDV